MSNISNPRAESLYGFPQPVTKAAPRPIIAKRSPTVNDTGYPLGQTWVNKTAKDIYMLAAVVAGQAQWNSIGRDVGNLPITPYVVGPNGDYLTIQSALDAANADGGGTVYVQPGTYTENLTLYDGVNIVGTIYGNTIITGVHVPPPSGKIVIQNLTLTSATHIFSSAAAGSTTIELDDCDINVTNGFVFNLLNWTGLLSVLDIYSIGTEDGFVNNTGGSNIEVYSCGIGAGTSNTMVTSGTVNIENSDVFCPYNPQTGSLLNCSGTEFTKSITFSNDSTANIDHCVFNTSSGASITQSSTGEVNINHCIINSSNNPAIAGSGAGTVTIACSSFLNNTSIAGTLSVAYENTKVGTLNATGAATFSSSITAGTVSATTVSGTTVNTNVPTAQLQMSGTTFSAVGTNPAISINIQPKASNLNLDSGNFNVNSGSITATNNSSNGGQIFVVSNDISNPTATARFVAQVSGSSGADVFSQFIIGGGKIYTFGIDRSTTNDDFVLSASNTLGTSNFLSLDGSSGNATFAGRVILPGGAHLVSGTGDPNTAVTAPQGSLFLRTDGSSTSTRAYINTDGATAWTSITTAA